MCTSMSEHTFFTTFMSLSSLAVEVMTLAFIKLQLILYNGPAENKFFFTHFR